MRSTNSPNPSPEAQRPAPADLPLLHITLNTGRITEHRDANLAADIYAFLDPLLRAGAGAVPGMRGFVVAWHYDGDAALIEIVHGGLPVVTCGLARGPREVAGPLGHSTATSIDGPAPGTPRPLWMAVVRLPGFGTLSVTHALLLAGFEACLGLALARHHRVPGYLPNLKTMVDGKSTPE